MKKVIAFTLALLAVIILSTNYSCKKSDNTVSNNDSGKLYLHIHTNIDTNEVEDYGETNITSEGRKVIVDKAQLYLSNFQMVKTDGSIYTIPGVIVLQQQGEEVYYVGKIPAGSYKSIKFGVGLDAAANASISTSALNHPDMWFGSTETANGHIFVNFQGSIDTTANATGSALNMQPFMFMMGTNAHYKQVSMPDHSPVFNASKDSTVYVHITADYNKLFTGVQLNNILNLMIMSETDNASSNANIIGNNMATMFEYED